jgi:O-antigen ligase
VSSAAHILAGDGLERRRLSMSGIGTAVVSILLAVAVALALYRFPQSWSTVLAGGLGLTAVLALAIARYDAAVFLGFVLFGVVQFEPAPPDAVLAVVIAVALVTGRVELERVPLSIGAALGALIVLNLLSAMEAIDTAAAARFMAITTYLIVFACWLVSYVRTEDRARMIVMLYTVSAVVFALLSTLALYATFPGSEMLTGADRARGLFKDANVFGPFLVPPLLILLEELLRPRLLRWGRATKIVMLLILAAGITASYSRGAWLNLALALAGMMVILSLRRGGLRKAVAVLLVLTGAALATYTVITVTGSTGFLEERAQRQSYDVQRFTAQRTGIEFGERYPVGVGPGQFDVLAPVSTHSTFIRTFAEQGLLGLVTWIALVIATLAMAGRNAVLGRDTHGIGSAALFASWLGLIASSFFVDTLHWRHLWLVAALIWVGTLGERDGQAARPPDLA